MSDQEQSGSQEPKAAAAGSTSSSGSYGYGAPLPEEGHLRDYLRMLYKRRWVAATGFLLVFVGGALQTYTTEPVYEARAQLLIEIENPNVITFKEVIEQQNSAYDYYPTQYRILRSRTLARRTIDALKLWNHPEFGGGGTPAAGGRGISFSFSPTDLLFNTVSWVASGVGRLFRSPAKQTPSAEPRAPDETVAQSRVIDAFLGHLTVEPVRNSRLVDVKFASSDPAFAARLANGLARQYIDQSLEFKFLASKEASDWLGERLTEQRKKLEASELALQRYREQAGSVSFEDRQNIVVQKLADLNGAVTVAKRKRIEKEALYNQIRAVPTDKVALETFPAIASNEVVQRLETELADLQRQETQLAERLGDRHPDMIKTRSAIQLTQVRIRNEVNKVIEGIRNEYLAARAEEESLASALEAQKSEALSLSRKAIGYDSLQRDALTNRQIFENLMQRTKETGISSELRTSNIRIVDPAEVPRSPVRPQRRRDLSTAMIAGLVLGVGLAFFFEYVDNRIKSPEEMKAHLGLPFLGLVPATAEAQGSPMLNNGAPLNFAEAIRTLRTNILFSAVEDGAKTLVVTSTGPSEGKTVVASNLAVAMAQTGLRVLLMDADMRRPRVHSLFNCRQEPGLSNVIVGNAKASEAVRKSGVSGLWLLASGRTPPNPAELLGSPRFKAFLGSLRTQFDWVILDTPPVLAVTDASVVAHISSGVLFVVGSEMTGRNTAVAAIEHLEVAKARFVGAVLNRANLRRDPYYYSRYYSPKYGRYYSYSARS